MTTDDAIAVVGHAAGARFEEVAVLQAGEVSHAAVVADETGTRWVLKWWPQASGEQDSRAWVERAASRVARLRDRGYPAPHYQLIAEEHGLLAVIQQLLPGTPPVPLGAGHVDELVRLNELQAGTQQDDGAWGAYLAGTLLQGADGYCLHEPMRRHSAASAALLERVVEVGRATDPAVLPGGDLVHLDFHHLNVLADGDRITGVVDCEGIRPGDRVFDLVTLLFCSREARLGAEAEERLWRQLRALRALPVLRAYLAHMALRLASWSIVHHDDATAGRWIAHAGGWLDRSMPGRPAGRRPPAGGATSGAS